MLQEEEAASCPFVKLMDQQEKQESVLCPTPVLPRLDRLDRLMQLLEEKHNLSSGRHICKNNELKVKDEDEDEDEDEDQLLKKTLASALEEVRHKGTLMERLDTLETRVLQLSLAIDEGNTSKSSSSTVELKEKQQEDMTKVVDGHGRKSPLGVQGQENGITRDTDTITRLNGGKQSKKVQHKRWLRLRWFNPTCS